MQFSFKLEEPKCEFTLESRSVEVLSRLKGIPYEGKIETHILVLRKVKSLGGAQHDLGLHFENDRLTQMQLFYFNLDHIDTDDEYKYLQDGLVGLYGKPTKSNPQDEYFQHNQWILENRFEIIHSQTDRGHLMMFSVIKPPS